MCIQRALGLEPEGATLKRLETLWPAWAEQDPRLAVTSFKDLREFERSGERGQKRALRFALASKATVDGDDDVDAAAALAWLLLPGVIAITRHLHDWVAKTCPPWGRENEELDSLVASELWVAIREFPVDRLGNVRGNVLARTKYACRLQLGDRQQLQRANSSWSRIYILGDRHDIEDTLGEIPDEDDQLTVTQRVHATFRDALDRGLIETSDARLLFDVAERVGTKDYNIVRGAGGLTSHEVAADIAEVHGLSASGMRKRIQRVLALMRSYGYELGEAA
ncbi:MAG: hypothetical protein NVSMB48_00390 [Marmoricola sp.]